MVGMYPLFQIKNSFFLRNYGEIFQSFVTFTYKYIQQNIIIIFIITILTPTSKSLNM